MVSFFFVPILSEKDTSLPSLPQKNDGWKMDIPFESFFEGTNVNVPGRKIFRIA